MKYRAVIFDLDGTLLDTLEDIADSANRALVSLGFAAHPVEAYKTFVGDGVQKLISRTLPAGKADAARMKQCLEAYRREYARGWNVKTRPYAGVAEMLDGLVERGVRLGVLSNKPDEFTQHCVREILPRWRFDVVLGASVKFPHKPDPASALDVAGRMGVAVSEVIYLGDTAVDMLTAKAAGMFGVGALWGFRSRKELEEAGARVVIERPGELVEIVVAG